MNIKRTDLESLLVDARNKGLASNELEHLKRHYYTAMLEYTEKHKPQPSVKAAISHLEMSEWVGYAAASSYLRRTIDAIQRGEKK